MKTKLTTLLICLLTVQLSFCQSGYPKLQVIDCDTVVTVTHNQAKFFAKKKYELEKCYTYADSLSNRLNKCSVLVNTQQETIESQKADIVKIDELHKKSVAINTLQTKRIRKLEKVNKLFKSIVKFTSAVAVVAVVTIVLLISL